jgi:hypothetical protein
VNWKSQHHVELVGAFALALFTVMLRPDLVQAVVGVWLIWMGALTWRTQ